MVKHTWKITSRGRKTKYYDCKCGMHTIATSKKEADSLSGDCDLFSKRWNRAVEIIKDI